MRVFDSGSQSLLSGLGMYVVVALLIHLALPTTLHAALAEDDEVKISPRMEKALKKGVAYLARKQNDDGSWTSNYGKNVGEASLAIMAFMSMGNLPGEGEYGAQVAKGVGWVIKQAKPNGLIQYTGQSKQAAVMYGHALSTLMLSEVWGQTRRKDVGEVLRRAVKMIIQVQGPRGGWGYRSVPQDGDTSVCVMQVFALKSAHDAGIYIPKETIDRALSLIKTRYNKKERIFGYNNKSFNIGHIGSSAAGTCIMQICDVKEKEYTITPLLRLVGIMEAKKARGQMYYYMYYTSVCSYNAGGKYYKRWVKVLEPYLIKQQGSDGSWKRNLHNTAFAILAGALPYRYIPVYQR